MRTALGPATDIYLEIQDGNLSHFTGTPIAETAYGIDLYLTVEGRVLAYDADFQRVTALQHPEDELRGYLAEDSPAYRQTMQALGLAPVDLES